VIALAHSLLGVDPLFDGGLLWTPLLIVILKVLVVFVIGLVATMLMVWFERKAIAGMQIRIGPNKAGPFGVLQMASSCSLKKISYRKGPTDLFSA
jgi:NADH-quinone oxidoreductase subunit H